MLIVLFVALLLLALLATWLKRRHDRKADQIREGFNTGITTRSAPPPPPTDGAIDSTYMTGGVGSTSQVMGGGSGRNTPSRARDGLAPYGYARSGDDLGGRRSPLARGGTPVGEMEKEVGVGGLLPDGAPPPKKTRRVLVRERSVESPVDVEKAGL